MKYLKEILQQFNVAEECRRNNMTLWQCPSFLFLIMGVLTVAAMIGTHILTVKYDNPMIAVLSVTGVTVLILVVGSVIIHTVDTIAATNRMKTEFISIASHQLRAPLSSIRWSVGMMERNSQSDKIKKEYLELIKENNQRMIVLVNTLLDVSRIEQGRMTFNPVVTNLYKVTERTIRELLPLAKANNVKVTLAAIGNIPNMYIDENKIQIVIQNLINNAIKYTQGKGSVNVSLKKSKDRILLAVTDKGVGIPEFEQKKVFNKFFRSSNVMRHQTIGSGLGLFIAKAIVEANCGEIYFESKQNKGTTFWIDLPIKSNKQCSMNSWV